MTHVAAVNHDVCITSGYISHVLVKGHPLLPTFDPEDVVNYFDHAGIVDFSFSKLQEASVPINGTFQLLLNGGRTLPIQYGATSQEVCMGHITVTLDFTWICSSAYVA